MGLRSPGTEELNPAILGVFGLLALLHWLTAKQVWTRIVERLPAQAFSTIYGLLAAAILALVPVGYQAFIYFQF